MILVLMCTPMLILQVATALTLSSLLLLAEPVTGTLRLDGKSYSLQHAVGVRVKGPFASSGLVTRVAFSDAVITEEQLRSNAGILMRMKQGSIHGITLEFSDDRSYVSMSTMHSEQSSSASLSGTMEQVQFTTHTPQQVAGSFKMAERSVGSLRLAVDLDFNLAIAAPPVVAAGSIQRGAEAQALASVQAYLAMRKAVQALDLAAIQKVARFPQDFQGAEGLKFVKMMKEEEPTGIVVVEASQGADTATLTITGKKAGKPIRKTFDMQLKDGRWTTNNDNWEAN